MPGCNLFTPGVRKGKVNRRLAVDNFDTMLQLKNEQLWGGHNFSSFKLDMARVRRMFNGTEGKCRRRMKN